MDKIKASQAVKDFLRKIASEGGKARAKNLTKERQKEISMMGVAAKKKLSKIRIDTPDTP